MKVVTYQMPYLFGSAVGVKYSLDRPDKLNSFVGSAEWESDALILVEKIFIDQGNPLDHATHCFLVSKESLEINDAMFEDTLCLLRSLGLNSRAIVNNTLEIFAVYSGEIKNKRIIARKDCPILEWGEGRGDVDGK